MPSAGALVRRWVALYTLGAPEPAGSDRRAELESDLYEHRKALQSSGRGATGAVAGRIVRGIPSDLAWRIDVEWTPERRRWHLDHPTMMLGTALAILIPFTLVTDALRTAPGEVDPALGWRDAGLLGFLTLSASAAVVGLSLASFAHLAASRPRPTRLSLRHVRRASLCSMSALWALSGVWRYSPGLDAVSSVAWIGFGVALLTFVLAASMGSLSRRGDLDFRKVPS
jgi:uncharacterized membrane protein